MAYALLESLTGVANQLTQRSVEAEQQLQTAQEKGGQQKGRRGDKSAAGQKQAQLENELDLLATHERMLDSLMQRIVEG